jgi:membrane-anchored glycerophosphoryl diester phosphodiesterase (GDPDase)
MVDLLIRGGVWFTLPLTVLAVVVIAVAAWDAWAILRRNETRPRRRRLLVQLGLFGFIFGLLGHALSLYEMMQAVERVDGVSPALVAGGLRVSFIVPIFGLLVFAGAALLALLLAWAARWRRPEAEPVVDDRS